ncbi:MAG TPA: AAA family ATPase, partial [Thermoanaerobaculia bacterium]|nr:AAA family ATPase [Thermoanaerobaculia bacterium]
FNGRLGTGLSHRLLIYFGYPQAHEEEASRAIGAAVELVALASRMTALADGDRTVRLALRAGVHTGAVIVATDPEQVEPLTLGSTLDLATGLQILAPPGGVVVSAATHSLIRKSFKTEPLPPARIAGFDESVAAFRVLEGAGPLDESMEALPPLVGREREIEMLLSRWILASEGLGQVVLLSGESGMGKSRLTQALRERIGDGAARWLFCYGSPDALSSPLWPVAGLLRRTVDLQPGDSPRERLASLLRDLSLEEAEPFLAPLLGLPDEGRPASSLSPERQKDKTLEALAALILEMAERQPVVLRIEDLQWLDPTSVRWLDLLIAQVTGVPLFLLVTLRPQSVEKLWGPSAHLTQLALGPLSEEETDLLIQRVAGERALPDAVRRQIAARTDGVPLFIEELTRAVLEGERPELPATLLDSLTARLDRLGTAKEFAQIASVIGRSFNSELLASVSSRDEVEVQRELKRLVQAGLVHRKGFGANARYYFKNQLVRDAAYESLLKKERQQLHRRIAEALEERFPESADAQPEILAHHFGEGGVLDRAIDFWHRAGRQALGRSANLEAIHHFEKGRSLLAGLPPGTARDEAELLLQKGFVPAVIATQGFTSPEVERAYRRALELCDYRGAADLELLWGLCSYHTMRGELGSALPLGERMLKLAESRSCAPSLCQSHYSLGGVRFLLGDLAAAGEHFRAACATDEPDIGRALMFTFGADDRKAAAAYESLVLWLQGHSDQAVERQRQALAWARREPSPVTLSRVLLLSCFFHLFRRDAETARTCAEEMLAINEDLGLFQAADARVMLGCAQAAGDPAGQDEGIASLRRSLDVYRASGFKVFLTFYLSELAAACLRRGRLEDAEAALGEAFQALTDSGESFWAAELHRLATTAAWAPSGLR